MIAVPVFFDRAIGYAEGVALQEALVAARQDDLIPDTILFLEHRPVVTLGRRARTQHLLISPEQLASRGVDYAVASRGGDVTYHGPGQLVMYPILRLRGSGADAHNYLWCLEEIAIRTAADFGVEAWRREGMSGAWTRQGKIAAIGFHLKRWVSMHGMSFNVAPDRPGFDLIVGCGLVGERVASLRDFAGEQCPPVAAVRERMALHAAAVLHRDLQRDASPYPLLSALLDRSRR